MKLVQLLLFIMIQVNSMAQNALEIVKKMDENMRGKSSQAELIIKTVRPTWSREMQVKTWIKGTNYALILVVAPVKEKGVVFLKRQKEVWNWIPTLERAIKLPPSMMTNSWMGTDFTNDDLVKEASIVEDYQHSILGDTLIDNRSCYLIKMVPKPETAVVWGKLIVSIDKQYFLERHTEFYDEEGKLMNVMFTDEIKMMDGRLIPTHLVMIPMDKKNHRTEIRYISILFDKKMQDDFFSLDQIKKMN